METQKRLTCQCSARQERERGWLLLVEGETCSLTAWWHGLPALGLPGAASATCLKAEHVAGFNRISIVSEPDIAGERFPTLVADHLRKIGYNGEISVLPMRPSGYKDLSALHCADPALFCERFDALLKEAVVSEKSRTAAGVPRESRPEIFTDIGQLRDKATDAITALIETNNPPRLFSRGGILTRLGRDDDGLDALDSDGLLAELSEVADWRKHSAQGAVDAEPPPSVVRAIRGRRELPFPAINGIARAPFFTAQGDLVVTPGFHPEAQVFLVLDANLAGQLSNQQSPDRPTRAEIATARQLLLEPFSQFPFADSASRAHTISLMLLPFVRRMIDGPVPLYGIVAPPDAAGTGKGLLIQTACVPGIGEVPSTPEVGSADELRKKLLPVVLEDLPLFMFDNVTSELKGGVLASVLTTRNWADRVLGLSKLFRGRINTTFVFTANGPRCSTEIRRRTVWIRLDAHDPEPWRRGGFTHELPAWAFQHRAQLVGSCITLVRHWRALGCPDGSVSLGSFERWAAVMGGILKAAEIPNFLDNLDNEDAHEADERGARWQGFITDWWRELSENPVLPGTLLDLAYGHSIVREGKDGGEPDAKFRSAATRLGLVLNRQAGKAFRLKIEGEADCVITLTRATVERAGRGTRAGFALKPPPKLPSSVGDVGEGSKKAENPAKTKDNPSPNVDGVPPTFFHNVGGAQVLDSKEKSQHHPTSPTLNGDFADAGADEAADVSADADDGMDL